jgi:hypothetical protein
MFCISINRSIKYYIHNIENLVIFKMTTENIKSHFELLKQLAHPKVRRKLIKESDHRFMTALCDVIHNVLEGNINISAKDKKKLARYKRQIRYICKRSTLNHKKKYLSQNGGFLQFLIPAAISGIASIISSFISKPQEQKSE